MKIQKLSEMHRGWFIGNFLPSIYKTEKFEVGVLTHKKDEQWPAHYHKVATEINVLIKGKMIACEQELSEGDIFVIEPNVVVDPVFLEDCTIVCVKIPSDTKDKYFVNETM